jgi:hypothetical protein
VNDHPITAAGPKGAVGDSMKRLFNSIGLTLIGSLQLAGCADDAAPADCLPGDIDCAAPSGSGGKADAFDFKNDPVRMSQHLEYRLSSLPKNGKLATPHWKDQYPDAVGRVAPAWADTYWPTFEGSHNARWQGAGVKSPIEKYDAAYNAAPGCDSQPSAICGPGAKEMWDTYNVCAGPAAKWQSLRFQNGGDMHNGLDDNEDGAIDECAGPDGYDHIATWWGTCHAWTPSSLLVPEPQHAVVMNGVTFDVADIKALIQNTYDSAEAVQLGGHCNSMALTHDVNGSANEDCADVNPGSLHVILTNFLGVTQLPLIEDRSADGEVWNQPVVGYDVTKLEPVTAAVANNCVGQTGDTWTYNPDAKELHEVRVTVSYISEGFPSATPVGFQNNILNDKYHYILELNAEGKIFGGRFCTDSTNTHVDFLWSPTGAHKPTNPSVKVANVNELVAKSIAAIEGGGTSMAKVFRVSPNVAIPDNSAAGISVDIPVVDVTGPAALTVSVDIAHTFRGDLVLELYKDGLKVKTLASKTGGSTDNIVESYNLTALEVGPTPNGAWSLKVIDTAGQDTGKINAVKLSFE